MATNESTKVLRVALLIGAIVSFVYGLGFLLVPGALVAMGGGRPVDFGWLRWPGGWLIALGIGDLLVFLNPAKQGPFVTTISVGTLLAGLALLYSWRAGEYSGATWFIGFPTILTLVISALFWWGRSRAAEIL